MTAFEPILVSVEDAGKMIAASRPTIYKMLKEGSLRAVRHDGRTKIPMQALKDWAAALPEMQPTQPS